MGGAKQEEPAAKEGGELSAAALLLVFIIFLLLHLFFIAPMKGPLIYPDELGYWSHARVLAGGAPPSDPIFLRVFAKYYPGYSLLLLPCALLADSPLGAYQNALVVNSIVLSTMPLLAWALARRLAPGLSARVRLVLACMVGLYPTYLLYAALTMAEALIPSLVCLLLLVGWKAFSQPSFSTWLVFGLAGGGLVFIHRRLLIVSITILCLAVLWRGTQRRFVPLLGAVLGMVVGLALANGCVNLINYPEGVAATHVQATRTLTVYASGAREPTSLWNALVALSGHLFYLGAATYGLFVFGALRAATAVRRVIRAKEPEPQEGLAAFCGLMLLVAVPIHAFFLRAVNSLDFLINGRYNEALLAPMLILGAAWVAELRWTRRSLLLALGAVGGVNAVCYGWLSAFADSRFLSLSNEPVENLALHPYLEAPLGGYQLVVLQVVVVVVVGVVLLARRTGKPWAQAGALGLVAALFLIAAVDARQNYFARGSRERGQERAMASFLRVYGQTRESPAIAVDRALLRRWDRAWHVYNYVFWVDGDYRGFDWDSERPPSPVLLTRRPDVAQRYPGALLAGFEAGAWLFIWVLRGDVQQQLATKWPLLRGDYIERQLHGDGGKQLRLFAFNTDGIQPDNGWTDGDALVSFVDYAVAPEDEYLELRTFGLRMQRDVPPVSVFVDGRALPFSRRVGKSYFYRLEEDVKQVNEIRIVSSTFAPLKVGSGERRILGIDVAAIVFVGAAAND